MYIEKYNKSHLQLISKLNELSRADIKKFRNFGRSPYFNGYQTVRTLTDYLYTLHPNIKESNVGRQKVSLIVYGQRNVNESTVRKLMSDTFKLFENFVVQREFENDVYQRSILLLNTLNNEGPEKIYQRQIRNIKAIESEIKLKDKNYYLNKHEFHRTLMLHNFNFNHQGDDVNLKSMVENLDHHFIIIKLWSFLNFLFADEEYMTAHIKQISFYNVIMTYLKNNEKTIAADHTYIYTYYLALKMFLTYDDIYLRRLMSYFRKNKSKFTGLLLTDYYSYLVNYLRTRLNVETGDRKILTVTLFKIYEEIFRNHKTAEVIYDAGKLEDSVYLNAVATALSNRKYSWAAKFIDKFRIKLHPKYREDAWYIAKALYCDAVKDYKKAISNLQKITYKDGAYRIFVKMILMEIYYKSGEAVKLEYKLDNLMRAEKRQNSNVKVFRNRYSLYISYFRKLLRLKMSDKTSQSKIKSFIKELKKEKGYVTRKFWMLNMAEELLKKK